MSQGSTQQGEQPCTCVVKRISENIERVIKLCDVCAPLYNERHGASVAERAEAREKLFNQEEGGRVLAPGGLPVSEFQSNIRTAVHS